VPASAIVQSPECCWDAWNARALARARDRFLEHADVMFGDRHDV
jgi:hypothetical protein